MLRTRWKKAVFVGAGGIGMSALARHFVREGIDVLGTDVAANDQTAALRAAGVPVAIGHSAANLPLDADVLVHTEAAGPETPEIAAARRRGVLVLGYAEALGALCQGRESVAVAGCHGKTTTTAMTAHILKEAGRDPGAVIGGVVPQFGGNFLLGRGDPLVVEGCEFRRSFQKIGAKHAIITNVGADHLDYYRDLDEIRAAFRDFAQALPAHGWLVLPLATADELQLGPGLKCHLVRIGREADFAAAVDGPRSFRVSFRGVGPWPRMRLAIPGPHNVANAVLAAVLAHTAFGVAPEEIGPALATFRGVGRRFEILADTRETAVVDDYAHHPDEILAVVGAARERFPGRRIVAVFQPHLDSRTRALFAPFVEALSSADLVLCVADYRVAGRDERPTEGARRLAEAINKKAAIDAVDAGANAAAVDCALFHKQPGDVLLVMGAGDVREVGIELARRVS